MGLYSASKTLASSWFEGTKRKLQARGRPQTRVDSGGTRDSYSFDGQEISRDQLREVKEMRESGGIVSQLVHAKAMMQFGTGAEFRAEEDDAAEWLADQFNDLDNLLIDLGEDATWFPYALAEIVETQGGGFSHVEFVQPWTTVPIEDEYGQIVAWEQQVKGDYGSKTDVYEPDEIANFTLNKCSGRDKTGVSEVLRAEEEIRNYKEDQQVIHDALEYLVPHNHWKIGAEGQSVIDDNELRRFRNRIDNMDGDTQLVSGPDVQHDQISLPEFDFRSITNNDLRQMCVALGVPIELASVISEGLGSGEQSSARQMFFELEKDAKQRALGGQFVEQIARILLRDYSPYDSEQELDLVFDNTRTPEEKKRVVDAIGDDMKVNERRELFEVGELDGEEGEDFQSPGEDEQGGMLPDDGGGGGTFFSDARSLAEVPDNAVSIDSPGECDGSVVEGPRGGMYCVPSGGGDGEDDSGGGDSDGESTSAEPFDNPPEEVYMELGDDETLQEVADLTKTWMGWPTDSDTAPMWQAAEEMTGNRNDPEDITGAPMLDIEASDEAVADYKEYKQNLEDKLREEHGDTVTAHRFLHSEAAERLQSGEGLDPRTLASWTTNEGQIPDLVEEIPKPDGTFADPDEAIVVSMDIPVENVFDHHAANPGLDDAGQEEVIVGLDSAEDLSEGDIQTVSELSG